MKVSDERLKMWATESCYNEPASEFQRCARELLAARRVIEAARAMLPHVEMRRKTVPVDYTPIAKNLDKIIATSASTIAAYDEVTR